MLMATSPLPVVQDEFLGRVLSGSRLSHPQRRHMDLLSLAMAMLEGAQCHLLHLAPLCACSPAALSRFLSRAKWDPEEEVLARGRALWSEHCAGAPLLYHIVDDTANPHAPASARPAFMTAPGAKEPPMEAVDLHHDHNRGRTVLAHSIVTSQLFCPLRGGLSVPWRQELYRRREECEALSIAFKSKTAIAARFVREFKAPATTIVHLVDSWYMNQLLLETVRSLGEGHLLVGALKSNACLAEEGGAGKGRPLQALLAKHLLNGPPRVVTARGKEYEVVRFSGALFGQEGVAVLAVRSREAERRRGGTREGNWRFIASANGTLPCQEILHHFLQRWQVEVGHWYLKRAFGFGDYRIRSLEGARRFMAAAVLAHWRMEWRRLGQSEVSLARTVRSVRTDLAHEQARQLVRQVREAPTYSHALASLRIAA